MPSDAENLFQNLANKRTKAADAPKAEETPSEPPKPRGRAKGKRSDPNYEQVGAYIPKDLNKQVKRLLLDEEIDFSDLVAQLLSEWVKQRTD
jgi:hypothetical protein